VRITYFHRRQQGTNFSIERVFDDVRKALPSGVQHNVAMAGFVSRGFWRRLYNAIEAVFRQGDVNHITGDVHYLACLLCKRRTLLTIHDCVTLERLRGFRWHVFFFFWYRLPEKRSALISVISESTKQQLLRYLKCLPEKIRVIYDPVSNDFQPAPHEFNSEKPTILQVGTGRNKNLLRIAEALRNIPCHLRIIGKLDGEQERKLEECRIDYSSAAGISDTEIVAEYRQCDMLVFVSTYEGFGLPIVEANATGRPVVTSNILSMPEIAGDAACFADPLDVASIRQAVLRIIEDSVYREELVKHGYKNADRFRRAAIAAQYVSLYRELMGQSQS